MSNPKDIIFVADNLLLVEKTMVLTHKTKERSKVIGMYIFLIFLYCSNISEVKSNIIKISKKEYLLGTFD